MSGSSLSKSAPELAKWYESVRRPFPWREDPPNPYRVWISEIMSHQSTMATVLPYFQRWTEKFPNLEALAAAEDSEVLAVWAGLGYYSRARNLLKAARQLLEERAARGGEWPHRAQEWLALPGVGPYSAAAIASICFGERVLPLDGNVLRVLSRYFGIRNPLNSPSDRAALSAHLDAFAAGLPKGHGRLGQALMELGSLVCRPGGLAQCEICPLKKGCFAYARNSTKKFPSPKRRPETRKVTSIAIIYRNTRGEVLLRKIPNGRRLGGQWELPLMELPAGEELRILKQLGANFDLSTKPIKHLITKYAYAVHKLEAGSWAEKLPSKHVFWNSSAPVPGTITTLTRKILLI